MEKEKIMVSILMLTYNHEKHISKAIEGVLMQQTTFPIQLVIGEDCSTDNTRAICEEYARQNPERILLLPKGPNLGLNKNYIRTLKACKGKYIAYCEGDDFWTDPEKLQLQVDFLENYPEYACVYHDDNVLKERRVDYEVYKPRVQNASTKDIIAEHFIPSMSLVFRNVFKEEHYSLMIKAGCMDLATYFVVSLYGKFYYIDKKMATYRMHEGGVTASYKGSFNRTLNNIKFYSAFDKFTSRRFVKELSAKSISEIDKIISYWGYKGILPWLYKSIWIAGFIIKHFPSNIFDRIYWSLRSFVK